MSFEKDSYWQSLLVLSSDGARIALSGGAATIATVRTRIDPDGDRITAQVTGRDDRGSGCEAGAECPFQFGQAAEAAVLPQRARFGGVGESVHNHTLDQAVDISDVCDVSTSSFLPGTRLSMVVELEDTKCFDSNNDGRLEQEELADCCLPIHFEFYDDRNMIKKVLFAVGLDVSPLIPAGGWRMGPQLIETSLDDSSCEPNSMIRKIQATMSSSCSAATFSIESVRLSVGWPLCSQWNSSAGLEKLEIVRCKVRQPTHPCRMSQPTGARWRTCQSASPHHTRIAHSHRVVFNAHAHCNGNT